MIITKSRNNEHKIQTIMIYKSQNKSKKVHMLTGSKGELFEGL
jgi:hypothetical protein